MVIDLFQFPRSTTLKNEKTPPRISAQELILHDDASGVVTKVESSKFLVFCKLFYSVAM